jgi:hypothetical protein
MHQYNIGPPFERIAIDVVGLFPEKERGDQYFLTAMDNFAEW